MPDAERVDWGSVFVKPDLHQTSVQQCYFSSELLFLTPPPVGGRGIVIEISFFLSFFISLLATLRENGWTDLHEVFREDVE